MKLTELFEDLESDITVNGSTEVEVTGISYDSRQLAKGELFVCLKGSNTDGHLFVSQAIDRGASAVVIQEEVKVPAGTVLIKVTDTRGTLAKLANRFFNDPSSKLTLTGVTGTNGKTTTTYLIESIARAAGKKTGLVGTVKYKIGDRTMPVNRTTPESSDLQRLLAEMVKENVEMATIEVSSHAIHQHRIDGCHFKALVFTNLSQDHLDYHHDIEDYFQVKASIFIKAGQETVKIINIDDPYGQNILKNVKAPVLTYGFSKDAAIRAEKYDQSRDKSRIEIGTPIGGFSISSQLKGKFNVYNALAATSVGIALDYPVKAIKEGLESVQSVPGRFETIDLEQDFMVVVDYAHTPDSLANVLDLANDLAQGRVITVFGCGGDRDRSKRPLMGKIAAEQSQYVVITNDNPRRERPEDIIEQIIAGIREVKDSAPYETISDRRMAIYQAVRLARSGDLVLIAGKGHEQGQTFADKTVPFDDRTVAAEAIREKMSC